MILQLVARALFLTAIAAGTGSFAGAFLQAPGGVLALIKRPVAYAQSAPRPVSPADGSEFVDSDIILEWSWPAGLAGNQLFALRIWADELPSHETWTAEKRVSVQQTIDSFSIDFGLFYWQVAVVNLNAKKEYESMGSAWSTVSTLQRLRRARVPARDYDDMSEAARQFADLDLSGNELIDAVHLFIHENSVTDEQLSYAADYSDAVEIMYAHAQGQTEEMPHLLCDGRSTAMLTILQELGIESRLVFLYKSAPGWIAEHTVLEVFNPISQYWQVHDLAWDFYYVAAGSGIRPNAESILFDSRTEMLGCPIDGGDCSAELAESGIPYFEALRYGHHSFEVWVNPDRFDLSARFAGQENQNLAEFIGNGDPRRVTFRMDSWLDA